MENQAAATLGRLFQTCIELANDESSGRRSANGDSRRVGTTEARKMVGLGKTKFTDLYQSGEIRSHKDGNRRMFYVRDLENYNQRKAKE